MGVLEAIVGVILLVWLILALLGAVHPGWPPSW